MSTEFETVIGLEVHCQLATDSKIFCGTKSKLHENTSVSDEHVNENTCPICAGHPGTLPVLNKKAVEYAIRAGLALGCTINEKSVFSRKNYFYPDLPKGYQISQFDEPLCENGTLEIRLSDGTKKDIRVQRIHMEEDAGKNVHMSGFSLVNLNRAGVPLIEIVTHPDMRSSEEAGAYLRSLHAIVTYLGICDGNLQEGNFRCDANVSIRPKGSEKFGNRVEIKNVNSFRFIEKAIEYEVARQTETVLAGGKITQETRTYDSTKNMTISMRSKEDAHDYRYFPDPDLLPLVIGPAVIKAIKDKLPELPMQKRDRYVKQFMLSEYDAGVLTSVQSLAGFFEGTMKILIEKTTSNPQAAKLVSNILSGEISRLLNEAQLDIKNTKITPEHIAELVTLLLEDSISSTGGKQVLGVLWEKGGSVDSIVTQLGIKQVSDTGALEKIVEDVITAHPDQYTQYKAGKVKLFGFFVGQVMKASAGKANPKVLQDLIQKKLDSN